MKDLLFLILILSLPFTLSAQELPQELKDFRESIDLVAEGVSLWTVKDMILKKQYLAAIELMKTEINNCILHIKDGIPTKKIELESSRYSYWENRYGQIGYRYRDR